MPKVSTERKQFYKAKIRSLLAIDHSMSTRELQGQLEQNGIHIDRHFLDKLRHVVEREKTLRADRRTLNYAIATVEDTLTETMRIAWSTALNPTAKTHDRLAAIREIRKSHVDMFNILFDAGIFNRKLGTLEHEIRNAPLSEEQKRNIRGAFERWGLIQSPTSNEKSDQSGSLVQ